MLELKAPDTRIGPASANMAAAGRQARAGRCKALSRGSKTMPPGLSTAGEMITAEMELALATDK
jgi:hypothetical protein